MVLERDLLRKVREKGILPRIHEPRKFRDRFIQFLRFFANVYEHAIRPVERHRLSPAFIAIRTNPRRSFHRLYRRTR